MTINEINNKINLLNSRLRYFKVMQNSTYGAYSMKNKYEYYDEMVNEKKQLSRILKIKKIKSCIKN